MATKTQKTKQTLTSILISTLTIFIIFLIIATGTYIKNNIKKGRYIGAEVESKNTISVSGTSEMFVKPDLARIILSVENEAKTVNQVMETNNQKMNTVIENVKEQGVKEKDLKTTNFRLNPRYEWYDKEVYPPSGKRVLVGYTINQSLEVKIRNLEKIGDIIKTATDSGANKVGNINFEVEEKEKYKKQVRQKAINNAKEKAKTLAKQLGITLVDIKSFNESGSTPVPQYDNYAREKLGAGGSSPNIQTGENKIESNITIVYTID